MIKSAPFKNLTGEEREFDQSLLELACLHNEETIKRKCPGSLKDSMCKHSPTDYVYPHTVRCNPSNSNFSFLMYEKSCHLQLHKNINKVLEKVIKIQNFTEIEKKYIDFWNRYRTIVEGNSPNPFGNNSPNSFDDGTEYLLKKIHESYHENQRNPHQQKIYDTWKESFKYVEEEIKKKESDE
jgi:hypothetical protein